MGSDERGFLIGRWIHSHEEDRPGEMVFRPASYAFPPSRGRSGFELRADGSATEIGISPRDGQVERTGSWQLAEGADHTLTLVLPTGGRMMRILSVEPQRLVLRRG